MMHAPPSVSSPARVAASLLATIVASTAVAVFLAFGVGWPDFATSLVFSQAIGLSIHVAISAVKWRSGASEPAALALVAAVLGGATGGTLVGFLLTDAGLARGTDVVVRALSFALLFGAFVTYVFVSRERAARTQVSLREAQLQRALSEKRATETALRLLRAQIEPHFLFNTLANVISLIDRDPVRGKTMLTNFTRYLRAVLVDTRAASTTLGRELEVLRAYLEVFTVRMGERLRYRIELAPELAAVEIPCMLVQPLVENAILHGLEPLDAGGEITIRAERDANGLRIEIADTGCGLGDAPGVSLGITSVRQTLNSLYGDRARLRLEANEPTGVRAVIELPPAPVASATLADGGCVPGAERA